MESIIDIHLFNKNYIVLIYHKTGNFGIVKLWLKLFWQNNVDELPKTVERGAY